VEATQTLWRAALAHAGVDPVEAMLLLFPGDTFANGDSAKLWHRGAVIADPDAVGTLGQQVDEANQAGNINRWRVGVRTGRPFESIGGLLRHELEHSRQFDSLGSDLQCLHDRAVEVLNTFARGLPGGASLYNRIPMEADANAASAVFVRARFGEPHIEALVKGGHEDAALFRATTPPQQIDTLRDRMVEFIRVDGARLAKEFAESYRASGASPQ
jgi:hypothetical protein